MNKKFKIAATAVSVVMAGTMAFGLFGCSGSKKITRDPDLKPTVDENGKLSYTAGTELNVNIIDSADTSRQISYTSGQIATSWKSIDGVTVTAGTLKPAWQTFSNKLGITFKDTAKGNRKSNELSKAITEGDVNTHNFINASVSEIMQNTDKLLDINQYLDYMPNYKAFLEQNPIVQYSLTMNTSTGAMYYIPYFDGNDDIEKYELVQRTWVKAILDDETQIAGTTTFKAQAAAKNTTKAPADGTKSYATSFMGTTADDNWVVETTAPSGTGTVFVKCDYGAALTAATDTSTGLGGAYNSAVGAAYTGTSGNIVDIMNAAINAKGGEVTGAQLAKILREYIKVAYYTGATASAAASSTTAMYSASNLADVFISSSAAWDADLMTAMYRCVVTNYDQFPGMASASAADIWALTPRETTAQRENDLVSLAGELYGVRGMTSRLEYTYINSKGKLVDARTNEASYDAAAKLNDLAEEGLLYRPETASTTKVSLSKVWKSGSKTTFMMYDYVQTQTKEGFNATDDWSGTSSEDSQKYDFAPIVTPVSRWDTNDDGTAETVMRFTESWRSVKNTGVCIPSGSIGNDQNKLAAVLAFIDYLYSNDGQIVGSYGSQASGKTASDGYWYGDPVNDTIGGVTVTNGVLSDSDLATLKAAGVVDTNDGEQYFIANTTANAGNRQKYFMFDNKIYTGIAYKDRQIPVMTDNNYQFFLGNEVGESGKQNTAEETGFKGSYAQNYTNYARGVVGAALPIGNKDQGFEYQCTAPSGLDGASVVAAALNNGTIKHVTQTIDKSNWWYTEAATVLPVSLEQSTLISQQLYLDGGSSTVGMFYSSSDQGYTNVYIDLVFWGYDTNKKIGVNGNTSGTYAMQEDAEKLCNYISNYMSGGLTTRLGYYSTAWGKLISLYN